MIPGHFRDAFCARRGSMRRKRAKPAAEKVTIERYADEQINGWIRADGSVDRLNELFCHLGKKVEDGEIAGEIDLFARTILTQNL